MTVTHSDHHADGNNHAVCCGETSALSDAQVNSSLASLMGWEVLDGHLERTFGCRNFAESIEFVNQLARISEEINHHPNFCVNNKRQVSVVIWTHKMNCLTQLDFDLAGSIDAAYQDLSAVRL